MTIEIYENNDIEVNFHVPGISSEKLEEYFKNKKEIVNECQRRILTKKIKSYVESNCENSDSEIYKNMKTTRYELEDKHLKKVEDLLI